MDDSPHEPATPTRLGIVVWLIGPLLVVVAVWMLFRAETVLGTILWALVLGFGLRDSYHLYRYFRRDSSR